MRNRGILAVLVVSFLAGLSPLAAESTIQRGIDVFTTTADGTTFYDFAHNPIPAGFFCKASQAFTSRVPLKGLPLATKAPGDLWGGDTVVERLDDAVFDANGIAVTRIRMQALSMVSIAPIKTACGAFHLYISLAGNQRVTEMTIHRTEERGGSFVAPLSVDVRMTFIPVKPVRNKVAAKLELTGNVTFPGNPIPWSFSSGPRMKRIGSVVVDTNGDLIPETLLPATSNFLPSVSPDRFIRNKALEGGCPCSEVTCHIADGEEHCYMPPPPPECPWMLCN
ncbi:MAG: hypothetical protein ACLGI9_15580 [Thermoanaerobaculia bacterium]